MQEMQGLHSVTLAEASNGASPPPLPCKKGGEGAFWGGNIQMKIFSKIHRQGKNARSLLLLLPLPLDFGGTDTKRAVEKLSGRDVLCHYAVETEDDRSLKG